MDFGDIESKGSASNFFNIVRIRENGFSQDTQHRLRKSPRKRLKIVRTSTSLVIDQLKSVFRCPGDHTSRMRTRRNWRPEFLMKYLRDNRRGCNEECDAVWRHGKRNFVPEAPKIYSIGLHSGVKGLSDDLSSSCDEKNFKKRFNVVRRPMIICKDWVAQSTSTSNLSRDVSLEEYTNHQTMAIDCTESAEIISKHNQTQKNNHNSHHSPLYKYIEEKEGDDISTTFRNDCAAGDHSFIPDDSSMREDHKCVSACLTRDAQIQTSSRKNSRRRRIKRKSKPAAEKISRRKHCDDESRTVADFRAGSHNSSKRNYYDKPWLCVRVLESKRAEYINKFTAVNRQIEEITATLRETCCSGENSRTNLENEEYFSSISDDVKVGTKLNGIGRRSTIARRRNTLEEKDDLGKTIKESESDQCKNAQEILRADNETVSFPKNTVASSRNPDKVPNDVFGCDSIRPFTIKEMDCPSNGTFKNRKKARYRSVKQISFDLNLTKNDDGLQEFSIEDGFFDRKVCPNNNFTISNDDKRAKDLTEGLADLEESKYCKKIVEEEMGEIAILENIKKRIDRDFDDPSAEKCENDTEGFLTVSQKSSNLDRQFYEIAPWEDMTSIKTIKKSKSTPVIISRSANLDSTETPIHDSMSIVATSEYSSKNSALSNYFSCTQIPSLISLMENEDELAVDSVDRNIIDSHSNLHSNYRYYNYSRSNLSLNNHSLSNLDSNFDRSRSSSEYIARYDPSARYISPNKFLIKTINEPNDTFEISEGREGSAENKICEREHHPLGGKEEIEPEKRYTADSTLETSKSSRYVGSIDSGVFSSSLIDLYPPESSFDASKSEFKRKLRARKLDGSSAVVSDSDSSCTDDTLNRKVNDVVKDLTKNLILCERRARMKLKARNPRSPRYILSRACKFSRNLYDTCCDFFNSPRRSSEEEIVSISMPSLLSLSDSEIEDRELRHQHLFC